jgi:hypothetical protein
MEADLPPYQLYNLAEDAGETENLYGQHPELEKELQQLLQQYIMEGRSTPGSRQSNTPVEEWPGLQWMDSKSRALLIR